MIATTLIRPTTTVPHVTREQIDRCHPIFDFARDEYFYQVESESDPTTEYEVRYHATTDTYTCTCPCGSNGFASCRTFRYCKHVYWCCAHYQRYLKPQHVADVAPVSEQPPRSDVAAQEDSWLN